MLCAEGGRSEACWHALVGGVPVAVATSPASATVGQNDTSSCRLPDNYYAFRPPPWRLFPLLRASRCASSAGKSGSPPCTCCTGAGNSPRRCSASGSRSNSADRWRILRRLGALVRWGRGPCGRRSGRPPSTGMAAPPRRLPAFFGSQAASLTTTVNRSALPPERARLAPLLGFANVVCLLFVVGLALGHDAVPGCAG
jgi:hypothetical protein